MVIKLLHRIEDSYPYIAHIVSQLEGGDDFLAGVRQLEDDIKEMHAHAKLGKLWLDGFSQIGRADYDSAERGLKSVMDALKRRASRKTQTGAEK